MPFRRVKPSLRLNAEERRELEAIVRSRTAPRQRVERAGILLGYADDENLSALARRLGVNRARIYRCVDKALALGVSAALSDLPGRGRRRSIPETARLWLVDLACRKPTEFGYAQELWTMELLARHARLHAAAAGHPSLRRLARGTVSKLLSRAGVKPHKVRYYVEKRDPDFEARMAEVLCVYQEVALLRRSGSAPDSMVAVLSYDEKPGIQAIGCTGVERPPAPGRHDSWLRDYEYVRHGTLSLLAGIDLLTGHLHGLVAERHRSREFVDFLRRVDGYYAPGVRIRLILDNHSSHISKETRAYLAGLPNRFEFVFTPKHGSWLNLIETFFAKMARTLLRGMRVSSKEELRRRIEQYLEEVNEAPVVFRWKYGVETPRTTQL